MKKKFNIEIPFGEISIASLIIIVLSGIILAILFNVILPYESVSKIVLLNRYGNVIRNIHYWSSQMFLVSVILHTFQHLRKNSEKEVSFGVWIRLSLSIAVIFLAMLSGFILKGDAESKQAFRIFESILSFIPFVGKYISNFLIGNEKEFQILYVNHIATFTIIIFIASFEHIKRVWTTHKIFSLTLLVCMFVSLIFNVPLHDGTNPVLKGPWYLIGLQEILHWSGTPLFAILFSIVTFVVLILVPKAQNLIFKTALYFVFIIYILVTLFALFFRGENWKLQLPLNFWEISGIKLNSYANYEEEIFSFVQKDRILKLNAVGNYDTLNNINIAVILGRYEGCVFCHNDVKGISVSHDINTIGCHSCHKGNPFTYNKNSAHNSMILVPGNLSNADYTCGTANCHSNITGRINNSLMNTMSGIINVDKFIFGEAVSLYEKYNIKKIKNTPSEIHLRNLCASCHIGAEKKEYGAIKEFSRGGGCNACHLDYNQKGSHPDINLKVTNDKCFGCHSRSGRISTSYEGLFETELKPENVSANPEYRVLKDGRVFLQYEKDIHLEKGMDCIDCHISYELMGDGKEYLHKEEQIKIQCTDCHITKPFVTSEFTDFESKKILYLRKFNFTKFLLSQKDSLTFTNICFDSIGSTPVLITKNNLDTLPLKKPLPFCIEGESHKRLSCNTCHTKRISQCISCHTEYKNENSGYDLLNNKEMQGEWVETQGEIINEVPALGVFNEKIETFIPGMILTLSDNSGINLFKRIFATIKAHNIVRESRSCKSCHNEPVALGYGKGKLIFALSGNSGKWTFIPEHEINPTDNLPTDAWIGFLKTREKDFSTRINARPFSIEEQKRILTVGACLTCHKDNSNPMKTALLSFEKAKSKATKKCIFPIW